MSWTSPIERVTLRPSNKSQRGKTDLKEVEKLEAKVIKKKNTTAAGKSFWFDLESTIIVRLNFR